MSVERVVGVRKITRFQLCERHAPWFAGASRARKIECMVEGGPGGWAPGCAGGSCRLWPGTDVFEPSVCGGELELDWTRDPKARLEELRVELRAERMSWGELAELQGLAEYIDPGDVELLEAAGVPEHVDSDDRVDVTDAERDSGVLEAPEPAPIVAPERTNADRRESAARALEVYDVGNDDRETAATDLMADLLHLAERPATMHARAWRHFVAECGGKL